MFLKSVLCISFVLCVSVAIAGTKVGNGGLGVLTNQKIQLFDFYEAGFVAPAAFASDPAVVDHFDSQISKNLDRNLVPVKRIAEKLANLHEFFPGTAASLAVAIQLYEWKFVDGPLSAVREDLVTPIDISKLHLVQVAIRDSRSIFINRQAWMQMDAQNQAALVFHEILYALVLGGPEGFVDDGLRLSNRRAREINAFFWSKDLSLDREMVQNFLSMDLPLVFDRSDVLTQLEASAESAGVYRGPGFFMMMGKTSFAVAQLNRMGLEMNSGEINRFCEVHLKQSPSNQGIRIGIFAKKLLMSVSSYSDDSMVLTNDSDDSLLGSQPWEEVGHQKLDLKNCRDSLTKSLNQISGDLKLRFF